MKFCLQCICFSSLPDVVYKYRIKKDIIHIFKGG
jgi:hypothetical protein